MTESNSGANSGFSSADAIHRTPLLSNEERRILLISARQAIVDAVVYQRFADCVAYTGRLAEPRAAFVTVYCGGRLRGCIGQTHRNNSLGEIVRQCAISAALHDPRFRPMDEKDIPSLRIEISVLSEFMPVSPNEIEPGTHGALIVRGENRGLLLPQVASERRWSAEHFLEEICMKAGLESTALHDPETKLFSFTAEVFSEADFNRSSGASR